MKLSLNWLTDFVDIPSELSPSRLAELLTLRTCEVEAVEHINYNLIGLENIVIGEVMEFKKIEGSEKLHVAKINVGKSEPLQVIFGSMLHMEVGKKVPVALAPTTLPTGLTIQAKKIMGVLTEGMLCLDQELGLKKDGVSIHYFPNSEPGTNFVDAYVQTQAEKFNKIVVAKVLSVAKHPNADRLNLVEVSIGAETRHIVCGGENLVQGMLVAVALPGAKTLDHEGVYYEIKKATIRGVESNGMICAEEEIGLPTLTPQKGLTIADLGYILKKRKLPLVPPGTPLARALEKSDVVFEVDNKSITHRPDLWGHYGMAREFAGFLGKKLKDLKYKNNIPESGEEVHVHLSDKEIASRFLAIIIKGIRVGPSPQWLQDRLIACGMRPVNNIVDITNFVMLELGHPLHAFDRTIVENDSFEIRFAQEGEMIETLDHKKRAMTLHDALVTNGKRILGIAGVMGGLDSEITDKTTEIILEVACWNPVMIRKTSQRHGLRSEAATRFEKSLDPEYTGFAFQRACQLITKICKGSFFGGPVTDIYPLHPTLPTIQLHTAKANSMIGTQLSDKEIMSYLKGLQFVVRKFSKGILEVAIPGFRATKDIKIEEDLIEEIARAHGYEKLAAHHVKLPLKVPMQNTEREKTITARSIMSLGLGFNEALTYSFYGERELNEFLLTGSELEAAHFHVQNPLSNDQTHMRISLIPNLLKAAIRNSVSNTEVKLFEIGRTYHRVHNAQESQKNMFFPKEERYIGGIIVTKQGDPFEDLLGALRTFLKRMEVPDIEIKRAPQTVAPYKHPGAHALVWSGKTMIASLYDVNPLVMKNLDAGRDVQAAAFELNFTRLANIDHGSFIYKPLPKFPGIEIDVSVLGEMHTEIAEVTAVIRKADVDGLIHDIHFIELYKNENALGKDKKSMTFRILLQSPERTLIDEEMRNLQMKIFAEVEKNGWRVR